MRGLTLTAPYGTLIAIAEKWPELGKQHETRGRPFHYRGWLAIHQGKNLASVDGKDGFYTLCCSDPFHSTLVQAGLLLHPIMGREFGTVYEHIDRKIPLGKIVALVNYTACYIVGRGGTVMYDTTNGDVAVPVPTGNDFAFGNYAPGRYAFKLEQIRALPEPIPFRGSQGLWNVPEDVQAAIWGQL